MSMEFFFGGEGKNVLEFDSGIAVAQLCKCTKCHYILHFKMFKIVNFMFVHFDTIFKS